MLREQGYFTAYKGKWHLSVINQKIGTGAFPNAAKSLEPYGFSDYNFDGEHTGLTWAGFGHDGVTAAESIKLLERFASGSTQGKPWFLAVNFINPHDIMFFDAREDGAALVGTPTLAAPATPLYEKEWAFDLPRSYRADDLSRKPAVQRAFRALDEQQLRVYQNYYFNCIRDVDQHVGALLNTVDRLGLGDNTIVIATADHGERAGAHGGNIGKGADIYKETVRVPLIVRHPDVRRGGETSALACGIDLAPTLLGFAGLNDRERAERYPNLHGVDVRAAIADSSARTARDDRGILFNYCTPGGRPPASDSASREEPRGLIRGVFDGRYKFGRYFRISEHHQPRDWETLLAHNDLELYDIEQDADEISNLAFSPEGQKARILELNAKVNALLESEVGVDDGSIYPPTAGAHALTSVG
jgi:arylsulfatase